jgi:ABC1 atypical kinase-like domain
MIRVRHHRRRMASDAIRRIDALIKVGLRLARTARSGRVLLARVADAIDLEWLPQPWGAEIAAELRTAAASAREPLAWRQVERILHDSWGDPPIRKLDDLDQDPVAVTPSAQVHRGILDGAPVALKVLRPGLAASVRQDLALLHALLVPLGAAFPGLDANSVIREFRERVLEELDLEHEAGMQRRFHRAVRRHPFLVIPAPITRLSHEGVLVSEWIDGVPLCEAPDPDQAAAQLVVFVFGAMHAGLAHADPVPDDLLVLPGGRLAILDFGATRVLRADRAELLRAVFDAFAAGDEEQLGLALENMRTAPAKLGSTAMRVAQHALGELGGSGPSRLDGSAVIAARDRLLGDPEPLGELILGGTLAPEDLWPSRGVAQLFGTIARVGATGPWRELVRAALREGWGAPIG